ncbi:MAG: exonuclease SbcCD subunit D [Woeseiaceae bacterium]|nr:exonuclease SbcCD subunit D [Woeseiaceae bacterium]
MSSIDQPIRFIHSSDWQLGMTRAFLSEEAAARFSQARIDAITTLGRLARDNEAQFIVVAGDIFESNQLSQRTVVRTLDALEALPVPVFLLPGNHDPLDGTSIFLSERFRAVSRHITVLHDYRPVAVPGLDGIEVVGAPWRTKRPVTDLCQEMAQANPPATDVIRIAVVHGQVDTLSPDPGRSGVVDLAAAEQAIREGRFHYLALGDRHSVTEVGGSGRIWYSGAPVATAFDEQDPNKALLVELDGESSCRVEPLDVGHWIFIAEQRRLDGPDDIARFGQWLDDLPDKECTVIKAGFEGSISLAAAAMLDDVMEAKADLFASLRLRERTTDLAIVPDQLDQDSVSLSGYARAAWQELLERADSGDDAARDALRLCYRLSDHGDA